MPALVALLGFAVAAACLGLLLGPLAQLAPDRPNERSLHDHPVPRTGGIAVLAGLSVSLGFGATRLWLPLVLAAGLAAASLLDDKYGLPTGVRLLLHLGAAALLVASAPGGAGAAWLVVLTLAVAWLANLYNFMDGSDGLAGGMAIFGFGAYGLAAWLADDGPMSILCAAIVGACAAFLVRNFHPARIFLGDVGSVPLGFLAGALGVLGWRNGAWPLWFPVLVFGPFIGDATLTLARRLLRGERVWRPHRDHYYQRLVRMGFGHRGTAFIFYGAMALCAGAALFAREQTPSAQVAVFAATSAVLAVLAAWVDLRWARHCRDSGSLA